MKAVATDAMEVPTVKTTRCLSNVSYNRKITESDERGRIHEREEEEEEADLGGMKSILNSST